MTTQKIFELSSLFLWPLFRHFFKLSKRCTKCILSEKYTPLKNGICKYCEENFCSDTHKPEQISEEMKSRFDQRIHSNINGNKYHALVLLSGGKDSAYILNRLQKEYPQLRILCVMVNNGFMSPSAVKGAQFITEKTKTDLLVVSNYIDEFAAKLRQAFLDLQGRGSYGVVDFADGELIFDIGLRIAQQMNIPLLIGGLSWVQVKIILGQNDFEQDKGFGVHIVFPLVVWKTSEEEIKNTIRNEGLLPSGTESPVVSNSALITAMSVIDILNNGYSSFEPEFAQLIREKKADRKTWLYIFELLEFAGKRGFLNKDLNENLAKLNLTISDIIKGHL